MVPATGSWLAWPRMLSPAIETSSLSLSGLTMSALVAGPADGEPVVLLHGFPDTNRTWAAQLRSLAGAGYRCVAPMLRGYEPSSQPDTLVTSYSPVRAADDLVELARGLGAPVHAVGHDWGSVIVQLAKVMAPECFASATLVAVAPMQESSARILRTPGQFVNSAYMLLFQFRGLAEAIVARDDYAFVEALWRRWSPGWDYDPDDMAALKATLAEPGVLTSALSYYRSMAQVRSPEARRLAHLTRRPVEVPTLAVTGRSDRCMDTRVFDDLDTSRFRAAFEVERLEGGHWTHGEDQDAFDMLLRDWIGTHGARL